MATRKLQLSGIVKIRISFCSITQSLSRPPLFIIREAKKKKSSTSCLLQFGRCVGHEATEDRSVLPFPLRSSLSRAQTHRHGDRQLAGSASCPSSCSLPQLTSVFFWASSASDVRGADVAVCLFFFWSHTGWVDKQKSNNDIKKILFSCQEVLAFCRRHQY